MTNKNLDPQKGVSVLMNIQRLLETSEDNFNYYADDAFDEFLSNNDIVVTPIETFKAGAKWFREVVLRNMR